MKDVYNKVADIIYAKDKKILYETAYEMAIDILKLPELKAIQVQAKVMLRIAEIAGGALTQWKIHIEESEQKDIADINHIEANTWKNIDAELKILRSNLST